MSAFSCYILKIVIVVEGSNNGYNCDGDDCSDNATSQFLQDEEAYYDDYEIDQIYS